MKPTPVYCILILVLFVPSDLCRVCGTGRSRACSSADGSARGC